jgi:two-component system phosphate regulon sensor histidine kinase PhoR
MHFQYSPYAIPLFVSTAIIVALAIYALRRRESPEARILGWLMVAVGTWTLFNAISVLGRNLRTQLLFNRLKYLGVMMTPPLWLLLALQYTRHPVMRSRRSRVLIFLPSLLLLLVVLTDGWTHWWWPEVRLSSFNGYPSLWRTHGVIYYVHIAVSYLYILGGLGLYVWFFFSVQAMYRRQAALMVLAGAVPLVASAITNLELVRFPWSLDMFFFTLSGALITVAITQYRFLDIVPVARQAIVEQLSDGVIVVDAQGRVVDANAAAQALVARPDRAFVGHPLLAALRPSLRKPVAALLAAEPPEALHRDVHLTQADGATPQSLALETTPLYRRQSTRLGQILIVRDITERVAVQQELERLYRRAEAERERLALIISTARDAIVLLGEAGEILAINPAARQVLQAEAGDTAEAFPPPLRLWLDEVHGETHLVETEIKLDAQVFHVAAAPVAGTGLVFTMHDITHFKSLAQLKDEFVATVSHDLRSPLTSVLGFAELALHRRAKEEAQEMALKRIVTSARRMNDLINDLLDLAKIEAGITPEELEETVALDDLARVALDDLEGAALEKGITLVRDLDPVPPRPLASRRITQVWRNLIGNAIKYTPSGTVTVRTRSADQAVQGQVEDTGIGIPPADQPYIFDKFYRVQVPQTEDITGTGLGLALVKSIVEQHGGRVRVESAPGEGSTFTFTLPLPDRG